MCQWCAAADRMHSSISMLTVCRLSLLGSASSPLSNLPLGGKPHGGCQPAALSVGRRGWWEVWGAVRKQVALVWSHSSSLFGLSCIRAPLLPRFTRGNSTAQHAFPPSCCSVLSVFRWVFPANQEPQNSTFTKHSHTHLHLSVCFSIALAAMAQELIQDQLSLTRRAGQGVSFSCGGTQGCALSYVYWYQKKDTETFNRILRFDRSSCTISNRYDHPQKNDFSSMKNQNGCELKINKVKLLHSATYYCSCYKSGSHSEKWCVQPEQKPSDVKQSLWQEESSKPQPRFTCFTSISARVTNTLNWGIYFTGDSFQALITFSSSFLLFPHTDHKYSNTSTTMKQHEEKTVKAPNEHKQSRWKGKIKSSPFSVTSTFSSSATVRTKICIDQHFSISKVNLLDYQQPHWNFNVIERTQGFTVTDTQTEEFISAVKPFFKNLREKFHLQYKKKNKRNIRDTNKHKQEA